ncbi:MAG TPA: cupin domain-containing protein [Thiobacillus sp.]
MRKIKIESHPDAARLSKLKVDVWPEWKKENSEMLWNYTEDETSYILEGRAVVTPEGGDPVEISKGNLVTFPSGMTCVWKIIEPLHKRYRIG